MGPLTRRPCSRIRPHVLTTVLAATVVFGPVVAFAQALPRLQGAVNDFANVIEPAVEQQLDTRIRALLAASGESVVVVTVPTYKPFGSIEEYATKLFAAAGVGDREKDRGVLVVLAVEDRAVRIETGYGVEDVITDGYAGETIRRTMLPAFRERRYGEGVLAGTTRLIQRIADARGITLTDVPRQQEQGRRPTSLPILPTLIVLFIVIQLVSRLFGGSGRRGRRRGGWHGGIGPFGGGFGGWGGGGLGGGFGGGRHGGGGGFGGFGGGMSGGGGASGRW
jgi:uncharacterized protein